MLKKSLEIVSAEMTDNRIKEACEAVGITQAELANTVGVSYRHMNRLSQNDSEPALKLALCISKILKKSIAYLFTFEIVTKIREPKRIVTRHIVRGAKRTKSRRAAA